MLLIILGLLIGTIGTLVGVGGGFILLPVLIAIYPGERHETLAAISMLVVLVNSVSGSLSFKNSGRIDYKSGLIFAGATIPLSILGAWLTPYIPTAIFKGVLGTLMLLVAILLLFDRKDEESTTHKTGKFFVRREYCSKDGQESVWSYDIRKGMLLSSGAGFVSSLLGIGGGVLHVPAMVKFLRFPVAVATATSQFIIIFISISGTATHIVSGTLDGGWEKSLFIAIGVIPGAIIGKTLALQLKNIWILRIFSFLMIAVSIKTILSALV